MRARRRSRRRCSRPSAASGSACPGVADPGAGARPRRHGARIRSAAAKREAARLRAAGAELVVALAPVDKPLARRMAREAARRSGRAGAAGRQGDGARRARGQRLPRRARRRAPAGRPHRRRLARRGTARRRRRTGGGRAAPRGDRPRRSRGIDEQLEAWTAAKSGGDPAFIAAKRAERDGAAGRARQAGRALDGARDGKLLHEPADPAAAQPRRAIEKIAAAMRKLDAQIARDEPASSAKPPPPPEPGRAVLRRRRQVRELPQDGGGVLEEDRARPRVEDAGRRRQAERLQVRQLPRHRLRRGRRAPAWATPRSCATCSARSATGRDPSTSPRRAGGAARRAQADAGQHLHRLPHRAALGHLPVRGLPARHPGRRVTARARARSWATARRATSCGPPRSRARRPARRRQDAEDEGD